jgi:hypothetical protein
MERLLGVLGGYSPECVEGEFSELRRDGVLRVSHSDKKVSSKE